MPEEHPPRHQGPQFLYNLVRHLGGRIDVHTTVGKGSTFAGRRSLKVLICERPAPPGFPALRIQVKRPPLSECNPEDIRLARGLQVP